MLTKNNLIIILCLSAISLCGCSRQQQGVDTVFNREKLSDFTTLPADAQPQKISVPMIPGKAVIAGAPFQNFQTQTGSSVSIPKQAEPSGR